MRQSARDKRNYVIIGLFLLVLFMTVGFAAFRTNLQINGTASISTNWCVGFDNTKTSTYQITKGKSTGTSPAATMGYDGTACSTNYVPIANLSANFYQPGDKIEYTLTIANKGSIDAAIESITVDGSSVTSNQTITKGNIIWKVYMPEAVVLSASTGTTTMKVSAEFQNTTDLSNYTLNESQTITVGINAVQDDGSGGFEVTDPAFSGTGTIYRWSMDNLSINDTVASLTEGTDYTTDATELPTVVSTFASSASNYYLKHTIVNNNVTESYVCFISDEEHCLQGGGTNYYTVNRGILETTANQNWFTSHNGSCWNKTSYFRCNGGGLVVDVFNDGRVRVKGGGYLCGVYNDGSSYCDYD